MQAPSGASRTSSRTAARLQPPHASGGRERRTTLQSELAQHTAALEKAQLEKWPRPKRRCRQPKPRQGRRTSASADPKPKIERSNNIKRCAASCAGPKKPGVSWTGP